MSYLDRNDHGEQVPSEPTEKQRPKNQGKRGQNRTEEKNPTETFEESSIWNRFAFLHLGTAISDVAVRGQVPGQVDGDRGQICPRVQDQLSRHDHLPDLPLPSGQAAEAWT